MPRLGLGLGLTMGGNILGVGLSAEALAWEARIVANGGTILPATLQIFDTHFFRPAIANGNILTELDRLNIYCGLNGFEIAARTNIIKSAHFVTPVSSPTFDNDGYKSAGTGYLDLNYNPNTQGVKFTLNSAIILYGVKNPTFTTQYRAIGSNNGANVRSDLQRDGVGTSGFLNSTVTLANATKPTGNVFSAIQRTGASALKNITNTTETTGSVASISIPNFNMFELCLNFAGSPLAPFDVISHTYSACGSSAFDYVNFRVIINNLLTALGV